MGKKGTCYSGDPEEQRWGGAGRFYLPPPTAAVAWAFLLPDLSLSPISARSSLPPPAGPAVLDLVSRLPPPASG